MFTCVLCDPFVKRQKSLLCDECGERGPCPRSSRSPSFQQLLWKSSCFASAVTVITVWWVVTKRGERDDLLRMKNHYFTLHRVRCKLGIGVIQLFCTSLFQEAASFWIGKSPSAFFNNEISKYHFLKLNMPWVAFRLVVLKSWSFVLLTYIQITSSTFDVWGDWCKFTSRGIIITSIMY